MALVLAIEPDIRQGGILKRIVRELVQAELILVESRDAAIAAIDQQIPDVILLTALMSPRDEDELVTHLRRLGAAEHLQTHTIPLLSSARAAEPSAKGGLLGKFRKRSKEVVEPMGGCDPEVFAGEVRTFLARAAELKAEALASGRHAAQLAASVSPGGDERPVEGAPRLARDHGHQEPQASGSSAGTAAPAEGADRIDVVVAVRVEVQLLGRRASLTRVSARTTAPSRRSGSASSPRRPKPSA